MIERLVVEVPTSTGRTASDIMIGGEPIRYGGQIAECITVKLIGRSRSLRFRPEPPRPCTSKCCIDQANARSARIHSPSMPRRLQEWSLHLAMRAWNEPLFNPRPCYNALPAIVDRIIPGYNHNQSHAARSKEPVEPVLDMDDIQGIVVPGFFKPHQTLIYVTVPASSRKWGSIISKVGLQVSPVMCHQQREPWRIAAIIENRHSAGGGRASSAAVLVAIAFSSMGYDALPRARRNPGRRVSRRSRCAFSSAWRSHRPVDEGSSVDLEGRCARSRNRCTNRCGRQRPEVGDHARNSVGRATSRRWS